MAHLDKGCETCDTQVEDNEQTFFAGYYKGIGLGVDSERKRILELFENQEYRFGKAFVDEIIQIIKGEKK